MKTAILTGTTASGKTGIALELARNFRDASGGRNQIEIINADSMLVYRGMDIGTAKPSRAELQEIAHHLIDIREPDEPFTAGDFVREAARAANEIRARGNTPLIVGGTGFYLKALLFGMWEAAPPDAAFRARLEAISSEQLFEELKLKDPESALRIGASDRYRLVRAHEIIHTTGRTPTELRQEENPEQSPDYELLWIDRDTSELSARIHQRTSEMLRNGLIEEVRSLLAARPQARALSAVGYAQVRDFLEGRPPKGRPIRPGIQGLQDEIELATRQLVKRQRTWFRGQTGAIPYILERDLSRLREHLNGVLTGPGGKAI